MGLHDGEIVITFWVVACFLRCMFIVSVPEEKLAILYFSPRLKTLALGWGTQPCITGNIRLCPRWTKGAASDNLKDPNRDWSFQDSNEWSQ